MPAYWIARAKINDPVAYKKYTDLVPDIIAKYGGKVLARGGNYEIIAGRAFGHSDDYARRRVVLLGYSVPAMFGANGAAMIGQQILIRGIPFEIVGILEIDVAAGDQKLIKVGKRRFARVTFE